MSIDFPNSPEIDEIFTSANSRWKWTGTSWTSVGIPISEVQEFDIIVSANSGSAISVQNVNFSNSSNILVSVSPGQTSNANVSFIYNDEILRKDNLWERGNATNIANPTISSSITLDCSDSNVFKLVLNQNASLQAPINPKSGQVINIIIKQDGVGGKSLTLNTVFKLANRIELELTADANAVDLLSCQYDDDAGVWYCAISNDFG